MVRFLAPLEMTASGGKKSPISQIMIDTMDKLVL